MKRKDFKKLTIIVLSFLIMSSIFVGCNKKEVNEAKEVNESSQVEVNPNHPIVEIEMKSGDKMLLELFPEFAPKTVENFVTLVKSGFYDELKFHRIMKGFMIQGGDPQGTGIGGADSKIKGEFTENGFAQNTLKHTRGVISMARSNDPNSASSQFFIMDGDANFLDGKYAAFGKLIDGEETLDKIANTPVKLNEQSGEKSVPKSDIIINKITVVENQK